LRVCLELSLSEVAHRGYHPPLLFGELEVKRADMSKDKLPEYPAPPLASASADGKTKAFTYH